MLSLLLLGALIILITGETPLFEKRASVYTYLSDSAALAKGANVRVNGILAGKVAAVALSGSNERRRVVRVTMEINADMMPGIPDDSEAAVSAENVLGSKYINISKGVSPNPLKPGAEVKSKDTTEFDQVVAGGYNVLVSMQGTLKRLDALISVIERGEGSIGKLLRDEGLYNNLNGTAAEARKIIGQLNSGRGTVSRLFYDETLIDDIRGSLARVNALLDGLQQGQGTAGRLLKDQGLHDDLRKTLGEFRTVAADLNAGKGTAGKLLKDEALHKDLQATLRRVDTMLDNINKGQGTLGQLMVNPQLYESLNGTAREMNGFLKDFRANPKKFLSIKLGLF